MVFGIKVEPLIVELIAKIQSHENTKFNLRSNSLDLHNDNF